MKWNRLFGSFVPLKKQNPAIGAILSGIGSIGSSLFSQQVQAEENQKNRDWQEMMWNKTNEYNSPKNQRKLLEEAGYNPYLYGNDYQGSGASLPSSPNSSPLPVFQNPLSDSMHLFQQGLQVESNAELQKMKSLDTLSDIMIKLYKEGGQKQLDEFMNKFAPLFDSINWSGSRQEQMFNEWKKDELSKRYNLDMDSLNKELQYDLGKEWTPKQIQAGLEKVEYDISEIVGRLASMNIQNEALTKRTAAECIQAFANAFKLRMEGGKYVADAKTVNDIRDGLKKIIDNQATIKANEATESNAIRESKSAMYGYMTGDEAKERTRDAYRITLEENSGRVMRAMDKVFGEYFNTNFSYSNSNINSTSNNTNWSESYIFGHMK